MADTIVIETPVATVLEVSGLQGPQGPTGPQGPSGEASGSIAWSNVTGKPSTFTPSSHTHTSADVTDFSTAVVAAAPPTTNASLLTSGTLADARLSATVTTSLGKADSASQPGHTHAASAISDSTATGRSVLTATDAEAARTAIGAQASGSYAAATHSHAIGDVTGLQTSLDGKQASGSYAASSHTHAASDIASGTLDNALVNWAAPSALGSTTAAAATVTDLKADTLTMPKSGQPTILANVSNGNLSATGMISAGTLTTSTGGSVIVASGGALRFESGAAFVDPTDTSKKLALNLSGISASTTRTLTVPNASGTLALTSDISAGGTKTYATFTATDNQPPASSFATLDARTSIAVLDFDDAATESAVFVGTIPEAASLGSGLIVRLHFMATTATSGNVRWSVAFERSNTDLDADSFDTATAATVATNGTSGIVTVSAITCTTIDSVTAGDLFRVRVQRLGADAADTMTGDAELVAVEVRSAA